MFDHRRDDSTTGEQRREREEREWSDHTGELYRASAVFGTTVVAVALLCISCSSKPLRVGIVFDTAWNLGRDTLTESEQALVKRSVLDTIQGAYRGFGVQFLEQGPADRVIRVEDTPYGSYGPGSVVFPLPPVGATFAVAKVSSIRVDALYSIEMGLAHCQAITACGGKTREQLLEALGRGVGATAAHELGHQAGLHFSRDPRCDDCYDGHSASTSVHFFGVKHWSDEALAMMRRVLPALE